MCGVEGGSKPCGRGSAADTAGFLCSCGHQPAVSRSTSMFRGLGAGANDHGHVERGVELPVPAPVETMPDRVPAGRGDRGRCLRGAQTQLRNGYARGCPSGIDRGGFEWPDPVIGNNAAARLFTTRASRLLLFSRSSPSRAVMRLARRTASARAMLRESSSFRAHHPRR